MPPEILLPATDAGAIAQMVGVVVLTVVAAVVLRGHREARLFAVGLGVATFSLMALRTLH